MPYDIRIVSTYPPRRCGIGTFSRDLARSLLNFSDEVSRIKIAAIDNENNQYETPVDIVIKQYEPESWESAVSKIIERAKKTRNTSVVLLQHEFGLDPDPKGRDGRGTNFVKLAEAFKQAKLITLVYLHTVLSKPNEHQKNVIQQLGTISDGMIVTTETAIDILESHTYRIDNTKLKHIDHGIRMHHPSQYDRLEIKKEFGLENRFLVTTLGLQSPDKGIGYGIRGYSEFIEACLTPAQRKNIVYLIAGQPHPDFARAEGGKRYRQYRQSLEAVLKETKLKFSKVKQLGNLKPGRNELIFVESFIDETTLLKLYGASNVMLLPYLNTEQISSGILADTLGAGRVALTTKFRYAVEIINSNRKCRPGLMTGRHARGILVDAGEPCVKQIAQGLDFLVFDRPRRLRMEKQAHQRGYQMRWENTAWALLQYIKFIIEEKEIVTGRGPAFKRQKPSKLEKKTKIQPPQ